MAVLTDILDTMRRIVLAVSLLASLGAAVYTFTPVSRADAVETCLEEGYRRHPAAAALGPFSDALVTAAVQKRHDQRGWSWSRIRDWCRAGAPE